MVYFGDNNNFWELQKLEDAELRIVAPSKNKKYYILIYCEIVRTNAGIMKKITSGEIVIYNNSLEAAVRLIQEHKEPQKLELLKSISYVPY